MRELDFCLCENKGAEQNFKFLTIFCDCTGWFVSDLVGNPKDRFSRIVAHIILYRI